VKEAVAPIGRAVEMITGRVTSGFGGRWGTVHQGLDIAAPIGTPIRVPLGGTVIDSGPARGFGLWVRVRHDDGTITVYGHINRSLVKVGQKVAAGEEIAEVGNRGQSTGPHLHIEVITPGGKKINPRPWLDEHGIGY
jgi:murein DD-endopeptidase MepM/ murein hydrolase activator NlpD